jgi:hypothetical protein
MNNLNRNTPTQAVFSTTTGPDANTQAGIKNWEEKTGLTYDQRIDFVRYKAMYNEVNINHPDLINALGGLSAVHAFPELKFSSNRCEGIDEALWMDEIKENCKKNGCMRWNDKSMYPTMSARPFIAVPYEKISENVKTVEVEVFLQAFPKEKSVNAVREWRGFGGGQLRMNLVSTFKDVDSPIILERLNRLMSKKPVGINVRLSDDQEVPEKNVISNKNFEAPLVEGVSEIRLFKPLV